MVGVPISYSIGIASLFTILQTVPLDISVVTGAQRIFVGMSKFSLTAIPFFILAGNLMNQGGIAKRLVNFVMAILGKLPGALLVTNVGANALFGAISGSASAAAAAVGSMVLEGEQEQGYDEALCAATNGASAPSGLLIPPSNALITYSLAAGGTSVAALFMAGYLPGIIWALCCMVVAIIIARKKGYKGTPGKFSWFNLGKATLQAIPSLSLIVVVIGAKRRRSVPAAPPFCVDVRHDSTDCLGLQHQVTALGQALAGKVGLLQRDPSGAESLQVHAGAAGQPGQAHLQGRGDKDVQVVAGPQVGVAGVRAFRHHHRPAGGGHRLFQAAGVAVVGAVEGVPPFPQGGQDFGLEAFPVKVAPRLSQPLGGALLGPEKKVVGVDQGAVPAGGQQGGQGAFAAAAPPVDGGQDPALAGKQLFHPADQRLEPVGQDDFLCVVFHEKIPFCGRMRGTFPLSIIRKLRKNATRRIPSILRTIWDCILPESPLS